MLRLKLDKLLEKESRKLKTLQFATNIPELNFEYSYSDTELDQQFHSASIGKMMTATLIFMGIENGLLNLSTPVINILGKDALSNLFVYKGEDFQEEVNVKQLLGHTSGINDYFESETIDGSRFIDEVLKDSDKFWTPQELLDFTRTRQKAIGKPGEKFMYSDTGYILLGLIIEKIYDMPFHMVLQKYIFDPLKMEKTGLSFYSENFDQSRLAPMFVNGKDVRFYKSLSCDFSGGGIFTNIQDMMSFIKAFSEGRLINKESIEKMSMFENRFNRGIYYGLGMMETRFKEFFFLLGNLPNLNGHIGVTGTHAWYDSKNGDRYVLNVGNSKDMAKSFRILIKIVSIIEKEKKKHKN